MGFHMVWKIMDGWLRKIQTQIFNRFSCDRQKTKHGKFNDTKISQAINDRNPSPTGD
jgi:hypothetical protein